MAGAALGFPFTWAQWKELQRQAMIYNYMMASLPVPPHLLSPITPMPMPILSTTHHPPTAHSHSSLDWTFNLNQLRFCNNNKDAEAEPRRCKRTDGRKWRCSRDVASHHHKYCERHMNRGSRPRSRKPVELQLLHTPLNINNKKTHLHHHQTLPNPKAFGSTIQPNKTYENISVSSYKEPNRGLDWTLEGELLTINTSEQKWQQLFQTTNIGLTTEDGSVVCDGGASVFRQDCIERSPNLIPYTDFDAQHNDECNLFLNPDVVCLEKQLQTEKSNENEYSVSSHGNGNLSPSSLTLSMAMAAGDALDEEMNMFQMGLGGDTDSEHHHNLQVSSCLSSVSGVGSSSSPGGPLAEALRLPSNITLSSNSRTSYGCYNGDSKTRVSSPSDFLLLHKTIQSPSDSSASGCSSPAVPSIPMATPQERDHHAFPFQWLR